MKMIKTLLLLVMTFATFAGAKAEAVRQDIYNSTIESLFVEKENEDGEMWLVLNTPTSIAAKLKDAGFQITKTKNIDIFHPIGNGGDGYYVKATLTTYSSKNRDIKVVVHAAKSKKYAMDYEVSLIFKTEQARDKFLEATKALGFREWDTTDSNYLILDSNDKAFSSELSMSVEGLKIHIFDCCE